MFFFFKQKTSYEMRVSDWSSDVCSSDLLDGGSMVKVDAKNRRITGYVRNNHGGVPDNFHNYFVAEFDHDFTVTRTWDENWQLSAETTREAGHVGAVVKIGRAHV